MTRAIEAVDAVEPRNRHFMSPPPKGPPRSAAARPDGLRRGGPQRAAARIWRVGVQLSGPTCATVRG